MSDAGFRLENSAAIDAAMKSLSKKEVNKLLREAGNRIIRQHKIFQKHWQEGQSSWAPPSPAYGKYVQKRFGGSGKFERTGAARRALASPAKKDGPLAMTVSGKHSSVTIHLRKMVKGKNVYAMAQIGRFQGVITSGGKHVSADEVGKANARKSKELKGSARHSDNPRPITTILQTDLPAIQRALMDEINITMKLRGLT